MASHGWAVAFWGLALPFAHRSFALELGLLFFPGSPLFTQPHCLHALGTYLRTSLHVFIYCPDVDLANERQHTQAEIVSALYNMLQDAVTYQRNYKNRQKLISQIRPHRESFLILLVTLSPANLLLLKSLMTIRLTGVRRVTSGGEETKT